MTTSFAAIATAIALVGLPLGVSVSLHAAAQEVAQEADAGPAQVEAPEVGGLISLEGGEREAMIAAISGALEKVETAKGRFTQYNADFTETRGDFYLRRPGRIRFEYDAPSPILILSDGTTVAIEDSEQETQDRLPLRSTPLALILERNLNLEDKATIVDVQKTSNLVAVTMEDKSGDIAGQLSMVFTLDGYDLLQWETIDGNGAATLVELSGVETGVKLSPRLFRIEEQDAEDERD